MTTDQRVYAQHEETGRIWSGFRNHVPPRYNVISQENPPPSDSKLLVQIAELQMDLTITRAERDFCILGLSELEERHVRLYKAQNRNEGDSVTLRTIRRVLGAMKL